MYYWYRHWEVSMCFLSLTMMSAFRDSPVFPLPWCYLWGISWCFPYLEVDVIFRVPWCSLAFSLPWCNLWGIPWCFLYLYVIEGFPQCFPYHDVIFQRFPGVSPYLDVIFEEFPSVFLTLKFISSEEFPGVPQCFPYLDVIFEGFPGVSLTLMSSLRSSPVFPFSMSHLVSWFSSLCIICSWLW